MTSRYTGDQPGHAAGGTLSRMSVKKNIHGRRPGRGIRPWLLIPKVLAVASLLGGFVSAATILHTADPQTPQQWTQLIQTVSHLFTRLIVPAVLIVIVLGLALLLQHPRVFLTRRWLQLKLLLLAVALPPLHLTARGMLNQARQALASGQMELTAEHMGRFTMVLDLAVAAVTAVVCIGRLKPRLGQKPKPRKQRQPS
jgi:uncharacterized membrane protein